MNEDQRMGKTPILRFLILLLFFGCGPMNKKGGSQENKGTPDKPAGIGATKVSKNSLFYVYISPKSAAQDKSTSRLETGENDFVIRFTYSNDLKPPSQEATVNITYWMPEMPDMGIYDAVAVRQSDGSYVATLLLWMAGHWEVTLALQDGVVQDTYVFETNL